MKTMKHEIFARLMALLILVIGIMLGAKSSAQNVPVSTEAMCLSEIKKTDQLIEGANSNDTVVAQASKSAVSQCMADFSERQIAVYERLSGHCEKSFADVQGTTSTAMKSYCELNAIRFVLSLQLQRQR